jgi:dephospho-CoA kinase
MLKLPKIAVTGGLACGKTSACRFFAELGAYVVSADEIVHQLLSPKSTLGQQVIGLLGREIINDHKIDRAQIAKKVFKDPKLLISLEKLLHPVVRHEIERLYQKTQKEQKAPLFVAEIPLLFEVEETMGFNYDYSVVILADPKICKRRFEAISGYGEIEYDLRVVRQLSHQEKAKRADYVIMNNGSLEDLKEAVLKLFNIFTNQPN